MKVLLINPFVKTRKIYGRLAWVSPLLPPLGILSLASYLNSKGHHAELLDLNVSEEVDLVSYIENFRPDLLGVTSTTVSFSEATDLLRRIKASFPDLVTVLGGAHLSAIPEQTMRECPEVDLGVIGEGEVTLGELADTLGAKRELAECKGVIYRQGSDIVKTGPRAVIGDLDILPVPDRRLLRNFDRYHHHFLRGKSRTVSMVSSRGCPFKCSFCSQTVFGRNVRGNSAGYMCEEIRTVKRDFGADFISFEDDIFNYDSGRLRSFCEEAVRQELRVGWGCSVRIDVLEREDVELMRRAGCRKVYVGIDSLAPRLQKLLNKHLDEGMLREKLRMVKNLGLEVNGSFMIGLPTETGAEIAAAIEIAASLPLDGAFFFLYTPYPGTPLRKLAEKNGVVSQDWGDYSSHLSGHAYRPDTVEVEALDSLLFRAYRKFYFSLRFAKRFLMELNPIAQRLS